MNLGKLLGAGRSFVSWRGNTAYRENRNVVLPKFNTGRNPFLPVAAAVTPAVAAKPAAILLARAQTSAQPQPQPQIQRLSSPGPVSQPISQPVARPTRATTWTDRLNPFRTSVPVAPPQHRAVQVELSLDGVKPVSNSLEDADIEVVPAKSHSVTPVERLELDGVPLLSPAREPWEFVGERMVKPV